MTEVPPAGGFDSLSGRCIDMRHPDLFREMYESGEVAAAGLDMLDIVHAMPLTSDEEIERAYWERSGQPGFSYLDFFLQHFRLPPRTKGELVVYEGGDFDEHARKVLLAHVGTAQDGPATIGSPNPVVESGGRYSNAAPGEAQWYYWDTLWIVAGLDVLGEHKLASGLIDNIRDQIIRFQRPPFNGNGWEYTDGSQPAIYSRLVRRDVQREGPTAYERHLPALLIEYNCLMEGSDDPNRLGQEPGSRYKSVARMQGGLVLNCFYAGGYIYPDGTPRPRPEGYPRDMATKRAKEERLGRKLSQEECIQLFADLHAGGRAGTDFADWMMENGKDTDTIRVTKRVTPYQNALMFELECTLTDAYRELGQETEARLFESFARNRARATNVLYDQQSGLYLPYDLDTGLVHDPTLQDGVFTIGAGLASDEWSKRIFRAWRTQFLGPGGLRMSLNDNSIHSWSGLNAWAPMMREAIRAAWLIGDAKLEEKLRQTWIDAVAIGRQKTGHTRERYHVLKPGEAGIGGEYIAPANNFSWTDAVDVEIRHYKYRQVAEREAFERRRRIAARM